MKLYEFTEYMKDQNNKFYYFWLNKQLENNKDYTAEMSMKDWFEQFEFWLRWERLEDV